MSSLAIDNAVHKGPNYSIDSAVNDTYNHICIPPKFDRSTEDVHGLLHQVSKDPANFKLWKNHAGILQRDENISNTKSAESDGATQHKSTDRSVRAATDTDIRRNLTRSINQSNEEDAGLITQDQETGVQRKGKDEKNTAGPHGEAQHIHKKQDSNCSSKDSPRMECDAAAHKNNKTCSSESQEQTSLNLSNTRDVNTIVCTVKPFGTLTASLPGTVLITVSRSHLEDDSIPLQIRIYQDDEDIGCKVTQIQDDKYRIHFRPRRAGDAIIQLTLAQQTVRSVLNVEENQPVCTFRYRDCWPKDVHVTRSSFLLVAYSHALVKFTTSGIFLREIIQMTSGFINSIAVSDRDEKIAVCVTAWTVEGGNGFRQTEIHVFNRNGVLLNRYKPETTMPSFRLAFTSQNDICVLTENNIETYNVEGEMQRQVPLSNSVGLGSPFCFSKSGLIIVGDSLDHNIKVFDTDGETVNNFYASDEHLEAKLGAFGGIAADGKGHVIVTDSFANQIRLYELTDGSLLSVISSLGDHFVWPLGVTVSDDGHMYVADHGRACVKKYRYC